MRKLLVLLFVALAAAGCKKRDAEFARVDAALAPLIPGDTQAIACLRIDKLKSTPFYATYIEGKQIKGLEEFAEKTGLDPRKDIWELVLTTNGKRQLIFVRGKFGGEFGLEPRIEVPKVQKMSYKGHYLFYTDKMGLLFFNTGAAVAGDLEDLKKIVDNKDDPSQKPPRELLKLVGTLPGYSQIWAASTNAGALLPQLDKLEGNMGNAARIASTMGQATMYADLRKGIDLRAGALYSDANSATQVRDALKGFIGVVRLRTPDDQPDLLRMFDGIQVDAKDKSLSVQVEAPFELVQRLLDLADLRKPKT
jgi:hypothetical protein